MHTRQKEETKWQWTVWDYAATKVHSVLLHSRDSHQRHSELSAPRTGSMQRSMRTRRPGYAGNSISHQSALLHLPVKPPPRPQHDRKRISISHAEKSCTMSPPSAMRFRPRNASQQNAAEEMLRGKKRKRGREKI